MIQINLFTSQKQTLKLRDEFMVTEGQMAGRKG